MGTHNHKQSTNRRTFLGTLTGGATAMGIAGLLAPFQQLQATPHVNDTDPDEWFKQVKGKHRMMFDVTKPNGIMPFAWPRVFLLTNEKTGSPAKDCGVVVVLRHDGIAYAFEDRIWEKYSFGELFKVDDPATKKPSVHNAFWKPKPGDFKAPGIGPIAIGINELQDSGVLFCVCGVAISVYTNVVADKMKMDPEEVRKDWMSGLLPGIEVMPSGIWAVGRAQEHGCTYCFAG